MGHRRYNEAEEVERIPAGGGYDEWFDVRTFATLGGAFDSTAYRSTKERVACLLVSLIVDWSLQDKDGNKLPITQETVLRLKGDLIAPVVDRLGAITESFLAFTSALKSVA